MKIEFEPIGFVKTSIEKVPRHWTVSEIEGEIVINEKYEEGLKDIKRGQNVVVIFYFNESPRFTPDLLIQKPRHRNELLGVFSTCSPVRPNPIGMSIVEVLDVKGHGIRIKGLDMRDGTPVLDIKPVTARDDQTKQKRSEENDDGPGGECELTKLLRRVILTIRNGLRCGVGGEFGASFAQNVRVENAII